MDEKWPGRSYYWSGLLSAIILKSIKYKENLLFFGKYQKYFISCIENISNFTRATHSWKCWYFQHIRWIIFGIHLRKVNNLFTLYWSEMNRIEMQSNNWRLIDSFLFELYLTQTINNCIKSSPSILHKDASVLFLLRSKSSQYSNEARQSDAPSDWYSGGRGFDPRPCDIYLS